MDFQINMSFSVKDIESMLSEYENEHQTGMEILDIATVLYEYTSGYPYLVSRICQLVDERVGGTAQFPDEASAWTKEGILSAIKLLLKEPNTLFDDMTKKLLDYPQLKEMIQNILFSGVDFPFKREMPLIDLGVTFGFLKMTGMELLLFPIEYLKHNCMICFWQSWQLIISCIWKPLQIVTSLSYLACCRWIWLCENFSSIMKKYMEIMIRNLWKRMDENYFNYI